MDQNKTKAYKLSLTPNSCPTNNSFYFLLYSSERLIAKQPGNSTKPLLLQQVITPHLEVRQHLHYLRSGAKYHRTKQGST